MSAPALVIPLVPVVSGNLRAVGYHPESKTLDVQFSSTAVYRYFGVPATVHADLIGAESVGRHFAAHVRNRFRNEALETTE